ncbi:MAG: hypothetical protein IKD37_00480 [Clostridia bacterium]|nr:hypothetical protein [Clostridia bacterium]
MLEVKPIQSKAEQEAICLRCGTPFDADLLAYAATVEDELVGVCQFTLTPDGGSLRTLATVTDRAPDFEAMFVLGRAALNFIDLCGIHATTYDAPVQDAEQERLIKAIGFSQTDGRWTVDLTHFFEHPCQHHATSAGGAQA